LIEDSAAPRSTATERRIRVLVCDMDGTLFGPDLQISDQVRQAIVRAQQSGVLVALATGRMPRAARDYLGALGLTGPQIFANGALVQTVAGEVLYHLPVDPVAGLDAVAYCQVRQLHLNVYAGDDVYVQKMTAEAEFTRNLNRIEPRVVPDLGPILEQGATKMVVVRLPAVEAGLLPTLQAAFSGRLLIFSSVHQYCEMVNPLVDKGRALRGLAERLGLSLDEIAAIGDGDNDLTLLETAGLPLAMGNATPRLKAIARHVVAPVSEDGVAEAIERYILPA
jgi:Cof subfamily protein (haloacid dehalogenase superfamily)